MHPDRSPLRPPGRARRRPPARLVAWRARWLVAALLVGCACAVVVDELRPAPPPTVDVLVAARELSAGHVLVAGDVRVAAVPAALAPRVRLALPEDAVGATLAVGVPEGLPLVAGLLARRVAEGPPGSVVAPVRFADSAVAALLGPGLRVDVLAATEDGTPGRYLAHGALVLPSPVETAGNPGAGSALLGSGTTSAEAAPVLLAVTPDEAAAIAGAVGSAALSAVIVGRSGR